MEQYDVFLSYRRKGGWTLAELLYTLMKNEGYRVSFDIDNIRGGLFNEQIYERIDKCKDFIVILDKHAFDRCIDPEFDKDNDWMRLELAYAIKKMKNIIPVLKPDFNGFPKKLPDDIKNISLYNAIICDYESFKPKYIKIKGFLKSAARPVPDRTSGCLKVLTDMPCRIFIDKNFNCEADSNTVKRIYLKEGSYNLYFESTEHEDVSIEIPMFQIKSNRDDICNVELLRLTDRSKPQMITNSNVPQSEKISGHPLKDNNTGDAERHIVGDNCHAGINEDINLLYNTGLSYEKKRNYSDAFEQYRQAAVMGYDMAMYRLGYYYNVGIGTTQNQTEALKWYRKAAKNGNIKAIFKLGFCNIHGIGVDKDYAKAFKLYKKAADKGHLPSVSIVAKLFYKGTGIEQNFDKAFQYFSNAAEKGDSEAMYYKGICYKNGHGVKKYCVRAKECFQTAAENGNAAAMNELGHCYFKGIGTRKNPKEAVRWYLKADENGSADDIALYNLAMCYNQWDGIEFDLKQAFKLFFKSAEKSNADAMLKLAICYDNGLGVDRDHKKAAQWFEKAALWFEKAAVKGNAQAMLQLGICYKSGLGVKGNYIKAAQWFEKAAVKGNAKAMVHLGTCYENGYGVEDYKKAALWFEKAAVKGNAQAIVHLGTCYENGYGVDIDHNKAIVLYSMAADKGDFGAMIKLEDAKNGNNEELKDTYEWYSNLSEEEKDDAFKKIFEK